MRRLSWLAVLLAPALSAAPAAAQSILLSPSAPFFYSYQPGHVADPYGPQGKRTFRFRLFHRRTTSPPPCVSNSPESASVPTPTSAVPHSGPTVIPAR